MSDPAEESPRQQSAYFSASVVAGVPWTVISKVFLFVVYLGIPTVIIRGVGEDAYGVYALCRNLGEMLFVFCALGTNTAITRFIPELRVNHDRRGLTRLLWQVVLVQCIAILAVSALLLIGAPWLQEWLEINSRALLALTMLFTIGSMARNLIDDVFTALFQVRAISIIALARGFTMLLAIAGASFFLKDVRWILFAQGAVLALFSLGAAGMLLRFLRTFTWEQPKRTLKNSRVINISFASMLNQVANMLMRQYTEIVFLNAYFSKAVVGFYDLGCQVPLMVITFVPVSIQKLFTSGFAEAYSRDPSCLNNLIQSYYKALIVTVLPFTALGFFLSPSAFVLFFGEAMAPAGPIAALFFIVHSLFLISIPLSMAIVTTEKILHVQPIMLLQVVVNLALDFTLIPTFGMYGAVAAVFGTWLLTIPIRLYVVGRLLGGIYFPTTFFIKAVSLQFLLAACIYPLASYMNIAGLFLAGGVYMAAYAVLLRYTRIIQPGDVEDLKLLGFRHLNRVLNFLVPVERGGPGGLH